MGCQSDKYNLRSLLIVDTYIGTGDFVHCKVVVHSSKKIMHWHLVHRKTISGSSKYVLYREVISAMDATQSPLQ